MIVLGLAGMYFGGKELYLLTKVATVPQTITCTNLAAMGPGGNAHIILKDFIACPSYYVYEAQKGQGERGPYSKVFLPALEIGGSWHRQVLETLRTQGKNAQVPTPTSFRVVLQLNTVKDESDMERRVNVDALEGVITNSIESLSSEEKSLLRKGYPQADIDKCYIFAVGRKLFSLPEAAGIFAGGGVLSLIGLALYLKGRNRPAVPNAPEPGGPGQQR